MNWALISSKLGGGATTNNPKRMLTEHIELPDPMKYYRVANVHFPNLGTFAIRAYDGMGWHWTLCEISDWQTASDMTSELQTRLDVARALMDLPT